MQPPMRSYGALAAWLLFAPPLMAAPETSGPQINEGQRLVFMNDLMSGLKTGSVLDYTFSHHDQDTKGFSGSVKVTVTDVLKDGHRGLAFDFLTGPHHIDFPATKSYKGNPIPILFLEQDIAEMARSTDGRAGYYQSRIRKAFLKPQVHPVKISFEGKEVPGVEVSVTPFVNDPSIERFKAYANKRYDFLFSDQVPGGVYEIHAVVPGGKGGQPVVDEQLKFQKLTSAQGH